MRVAITHPYSWPEVRRGAERILVETARALANRGHQVTVITSGREPGRTTEGGVITIRYRRLFRDHFRHEHWFGWRLVPDLLAGRFDVVHSLFPRDSVGAIRSARFRHHRTVYEEMGNPFRDKVIARKDGKARQRVIRAVDVYGCMSEFSRATLEAGWGRKGTIIPGGVRLDQFTPEPRHEHPTILFSGAIEPPEKGVALLLEAVAVLSERRPDVRVQLSGPGDASRLLAAARAPARDRTEVLPIGAPEGLSSQYAKAWATCLPTSTDSFGLVTIESLAAGTPIVVGNAGAPRELTAMADGVGAAAAALEPEPLAEALDAVLDLAKDPATAGRCRALAHSFDWDETIAPLLEDLYAGTDRL